MDVRAVVELNAQHGRAGAKPLLHHIYRSSAVGVIAIVLNGIDWRAIDSLTDEAVRQLPLTIPGLRYFALDDPGLPAAIAGAGFIFASTRLFRAWLDGHGVERVAVLPMRRIRSLLPCIVTAPKIVRPGPETLAHA